MKLHATEILKEFEPKIKCFAEFAVLDGMSEDKIQMYLKSLAQVSTLYEDAKFGGTCEELLNDEFRVEYINEMLVAILNRYERLCKRVR